MSSAVIASGIVAAVAFGFGAHSQAMLKAGSQRHIRPVVDALTLSLTAWLAMFAAALGSVYLMPLWAGRTMVVLAIFYLILTGLTRYLAQPRAIESAAGHLSAAAAGLQQLKSGDAWAVVMFVAGSASNGTLTLASAFAGLTLLITMSLGAWAVAGWSGCQLLNSAWHRRHLDWALGIFLFIAGVTALLPG